MNMYKLSMQKENNLYVIFIKNKYKNISNLFYKIN